MTRRLSTTVFALVAMLLVGAMTAWACTNLATLNLSESAAQAGETIDVTGSSFRTADRGGQAVEIHWNGADGPVLATATPDAAGNIAARVRIPADAGAGYFVLVATQMSADDDGALSPAYGTPARASILIGSTAPAEQAASAAAPAAAAPEASSTGLIALTALLALLGIGLFGAGLGLFVGEVRRRGVPAPVRKE